MSVENSVGIQNDLYIQAEVEVKPKPTVGEQFRDLREQRGLSQRELSKRTGIPRTSISDIETGVSDPSFSRLTRLAQELDAEIRITPHIITSGVDPFDEMA
jgi:transcriptional regulator with XRE-family HTH domain